MKVVFLDIDGVLNATGVRYPEQEHPLDPLLLALVNRIGMATGAVGVLTTTWRMLYPWPETRDILVRHGLTLPIVSETRDLWADGEEPERARRREIEAWLANHDADRYVILDDLPVYADDHPCFVRTDESLGLTDADAGRARMILGDA